MIICKISFDLISIEYIAETEMKVWFAWAYQNAKFHVALRLNGHANILRESKIYRRQVQCTVQCDTDLASFQTEMLIEMIFKQGLNNGQYRLQTGYKNAD